MGLGSLLAQQCLHIHFFILDLEAEYLMRVVDILVDEGVLKHLRCAESHEQVPRHVVGQVSHHDRSPPSLIDGATVYLQEVQVAIDIDLAVLIVHDSSSWQDLAIILREVEQRLELVDVGALHEVRWMERYFEPLGHCELLVAEDALVLLTVLINGHVHLECSRVEVEHDGLFAEAESRQSPSDHVVDVVVQRLLYVDGRRVDRHSVSPNLAHRHHSLLKL